MALGDGSLPLDSFKGYIIQDYLYLVRHPVLLFVFVSVLTKQIHFSRANALAAYKSTNMTDIARVGAPSSSVVIYLP